LIKTRLNRDYRELALRRRQVWRIELFRGAGRDNGIGQMAIQLAEMFFLSARQQLFVAGKRKNQHRRKVCTGDDHHRHHHKFCARALANDE